MLKRLDRYFPMAMALLMTAVVVFGFSQTIDRKLLHPIRPPPPIVILHALLFSAWVLLFLIQISLARLRKVKLHMALGLAGCVIGVAVPVLGLVTALVMKQWRMAQLGETDLSDLSIPMNDMLTFAVCFGLAILWRRKAEKHRRLMLMAMAALTVAAFARFPDTLMPDLGWYGAADLLILLAMAWDFLARRKIHGVYLAGLPLIMAGQAVALALMLTAPDWWTSALAAVVPDPGRWTASWSAAPQPGDGTVVEDQTLRLIVHTSIGGSQARIRLSNLYGTEPLTVADAEIASHPLTFHGKSTMTIAPGDEIESDAALLQVAAYSNVAVSFHLPGHVEIRTTHVLAQQTSQIGETSIESWPFLTALDVLAPPGAISIVAFGDSTIDGDGSTENANRRWPDQLAVHLGLGFGVANEGLIGNRLLRGSPDKSRAEFGDIFGDAGLKRFDRDVLGRAGAKFVILRLGNNDIAFPGSFADESEKPGVNDLAEGFRQLAKRARKAGLKVIVTTLPPSEGSLLSPTYWSPDKETARLAFNGWLRTSAEFDGLIDFDAVLRDPDHPSRLRPDFDSGDHTHPNDEGYRAVAESVLPDLFR